MGTEKIFSSAHMSRLPGDRVFFLDALKATGIVMVVAVHTFRHVELEKSSLDVLSFLAGTIAVPLFLVADGFLFSRKLTGSAAFDFSSFVKRSAWRLLVPWAAFTVIYGLLRVVLESLGLTRGTIILGQDWMAIAWAVYLSGFSEQLYFLLSLFLIRLGSWVVWKSLPLPSWIWCGVVSLYVAFFVLANPKQWFLPGADPILLACWGTQFYLLGILLEKVQDLVRPVAVWATGASLVAAASFWMVGSPRLGFLTQILYLLGIVGVVMLVTERTACEFSMGRDTMGIYLTHTPLIVWSVAAVVNRILHPGHVVTALTAVVVTVGASWMVTKGLTKTKIGAVLLGQPRIANVTT